MDAAEISRTVYELMDMLKPEERISLIEGLYTADLSGEAILDPGSKAVRFHELSFGDKFIWMLCPEDGRGNGGLDRKCAVFRKIKRTTSARTLELCELFNSARADTDEAFTVHPAAWVIRVE